MNKSILGLRRFLWFSMGLLLSTLLISCGDGEDFLIAAGGGGGGGGDEEPPIEGPPPDGPSSGESPKVAVVGDVSGSTLAVFLRDEALLRNQDLEVYNFAGITHPKPLKGPDGPTDPPEGPGDDGVEDDDGEDEVEDDSSHSTSVVSHKRLELFLLFLRERGNVQPG